MSINFACMHGSDLIMLHAYICSASTRMGATSASASSTSTFSMTAAAEAKSPPKHPDS